MAADDLVAPLRDRRPSRAILDGLGGVLCRCTGYTAIVDAVRDVGAGCRPRRRRPAHGRPRGRGADRRATDGVEKVTRGRALRRRPRPRRACSCCGPSARRTTTRRFTVGDLGAAPRTTPGPRARPHRRRRARPEPVRDLRDRQGPARPGRRPRALPWRGGPGPGRRRGDASSRSTTTSCRSRGSRCRPLHRHRRRARSGRRAPPRGLARQRPRRGGRPAGRRRRRPRRVRGHRDRDVRDDLRRARLHRARGGHGPRRRRPDRGLRHAPRRRTWTATSSR